MAKMHIKKDLIVIVDSFSSGAHYAPIFSGMGFPCVHINSNNRIFKNKDYGKKFYIDHVLFENNMDKILKKFKPYRVKAVIAGSEIGVNLADLIASHFDVLKNDWHTTQNRRNKFLMIHALENKNIPCPKQYCSNDLNELINWYKKSGLNKVILKPILSTSSDGVIICTNVHEIKNAFQKEFNKINCIGFLNEALVMQEYLEGPEYIVNTVSCQGQHFVTDVWRGFGGIENTISSDKYAQMVMKNSDEYTVLKKYAEQTLDAIGILNGPAHAEIKYTKSGPKLIEIASRLAGLFDFSVIQKCQGYSQLSVSVETYLDPELFAERTAIYERLPQKKLMRFVYFNSDISGLIKKPPPLKKFLKLDSVESLQFLLKKGDYLNITSKTIGRPGFASLLSSNLENLERDYFMLRNLEKDFYESITR